VAVAVAAVAALDRRSLGDGEWARVALVAVGGVVDRQLVLAGADDRVGEAVGTRRAEVGMEEVAAGGVALEMSWFQAASVARDGALAGVPGGGSGKTEQLPRSG
jgi:hypothetical protein